MSLSYTVSPFHPTNPYPNQVTTELDLANQNFTTLAQAFVNADPTSLTVVNSMSVGGYGVSATPQPNTLLPLNANAQFPYSVLPAGIGNGYANPINLTSATADYMLQPGEVAYISFTSATSVPLNIATTNGTYYEMNIVVSNSSGTSSANVEIVYLLPNNTTYSQAFIDHQIYDAGGLGNGSLTVSAFYLGDNYTSSIVYITNFTTAKYIKGYTMNWGNIVDISTIVIHSCVWNDTTTSWSSLGTITFPQASSGYVLVRRLA